MMTLQAYEKLPGGARFEYEVKHSTPGREGTTLTQNLSLFIRPDKAWCDMVIKDCEGADHQEALTRMAGWLRRLADGIDQRRETTIPL